jgi:hypothetical protein
MKYMQMVAIVFIMFFVGCSSNRECNNIPYWKGDSVAVFKDKALSSMLWIWPPPYDDNLECCFEKSQVFKRFDDDDFQVLLRCLDNPEIRRPVQDERLGRYLYVSFLDGTRYLIDFRFNHEKRSVILINGQSQILYQLIGEKEVCSSFKPLDPRMNLYGEVNDPNVVMQ